MRFPVRVGVRKATAALLVGAMLAIGGTPQLGAAQATSYSTSPSIIMIGGPLSDPFWSAVKKGGDQAGRDLGVNFEYQAPGDLSGGPGPVLARLVAATAARKPDAIVSGDWFPDAMNPEFTSAIGSGIPVVFVNTASNWEQLGGLAFVGEDPTLVGSIAGQKLAAAGSRHAVCVDQVPGQPYLEARCTGFEQAIQQAGGTVAQRLIIPVDQNTNPQYVTQAIAGVLTADPTIDGVFTLASQIAEYAVSAIDSVGDTGTVQLGTTDLSNNDLGDIQQGKLLFAVDQQPYLQGYYGVLIAAQKVRFGVQPIGQIRTAPLLVTTDNVAQVLNMNLTQPGVRGAS